MTNIRTQRTKAAIREALLSYVKEKPIDDISIAEVCRRAKIDRTTFYRHYKDLNDVVDEMVKEQRDYFRSLLEEEHSSTEEILNRFLLSMERVKEIYRTDKGGEISESFKSDIVDTAKEYGLKNWNRDHPSEDRIKSELLFDAFLAGVLQIAINRENKADRGTVVAAIMDLINRNYDRRLGA